MTLSKVIEKLRKIKAHSESAEKIGSMDEAEAFAAMFQQLLLRHKLEATDIEFEEEEKEEPVEEHIVEWQDIQFGHKRVGWVERLASIVAKAHFCRIMVCSGSSRITLVGRQSDIEIAEFMLVTLVRIADKLVRKECRKYRKENPGANTKGYRVSFMRGFIERLAERYREERHSAEVSTSTALVRINRAETAVTTYMDRYTKLASAVGQSNKHNAEGRRRGRAVASSLNLKANGVKAGRSSNQLA